MTESIRTGRRHGDRQGKPGARSNRLAAPISVPTQKLRGKKKKKNRKCGEALSPQTPLPLPSPPARLHLPKSFSPSQIAPPAGVQVFKYLSVGGGGTLLTQTTIYPQTMCASSAYSGLQLLISAGGGGQTLKWSLWSALCCRALSVQGVAGPIICF